MASLIGKIALLLPAVAAATSVSSNLTAVDWKTGDAKVDTLIANLTAEEKIGLVTGVYSSGNQDIAGYLSPVARLGIPAIQLSDGEAGINVVVDATSIPSQLNVAATWSRLAAYEAGYVAGREAKLLNATVALAPRVNILRDPATGNFWQGYSEDPFLNSQLGVQGVLGIQSQGTMANSKQIGPSSTGASHGDDNSVVDLQVLHEVYWPAYEAQLAAGCATLMCSYVQVNGYPSCENPETFRTIREDWGFKGIVMSDWGATHSTANSIIAGLDLEMPTTLYYGQGLYDQIYVTKNLSETYLNRAVGHILSKYDQFGLLKGTSAATSEILITNDLPSTVVFEDALIAYDIAVKSGILLKNNGGLPLKPSASFGVFGPNGLQYTHGTNFAERAYGIQSRQLSAFQALESRTGKTDIPNSVGIDLDGTTIPESALISLNGTNGLSRSDKSGNYAIDPVVDFSGATALPANQTYTWQGYLNASEAGLYRLSLAREIFFPGGTNNNSDYDNTLSIGGIYINGTEVANGYRLYLDGGVRPWSGPLTTRDGRDNIGTTVELTAGLHPITLNIIGVIGQNVTVRFAWVTPSQRTANIAAAVALAKTVDTPIVFASAESPAQTYLTLDDSQDDLITAISAANPNTVVVLNNAEPVTMPWLSSVKSVLAMGYAGQEGGYATADLLLGVRVPQGRLPVTYPTALNKTVTRDPAYPGRVATASGSANFSEGLNSTYRWYYATETPVLFPFGYGLSYTTFNYSSLSVYPQPQSSTTPLSVSFTITNTGSTDGVEIPQLYIGPPANYAENYPGIQFAATKLVGFENVPLLRGQKTEVVITVDARQFSFWNVTDRTWVFANGTRQLFVGTDAQTPVLAGEVTF